MARVIDGQAGVSRVWMATGETNVNSAVAVPVHRHVFS